MVAPPKKVRTRLVKASKGTIAVPFCPETVIERLLCGLFLYFKIGLIELLVLTQFSGQLWPRAGRDIDETWKSGALTSH